MEQEPSMAKKKRLSKHPTLDEKVLAYWRLARCWNQGTGEFTTGDAIDLANDIRRSSDPRRRVTIHTNALLDAIVCKSVTRKSKKPKQLGGLIQLHPTK